MPERGAWSPQWVPLATKWPVSLATDVAPEVLPDGKTPDAYGLGLDKPGYLYYEASPSSGTAWKGIDTVSTPTNTPLTGTQYWRFYHGRLWGYKLDSNKVTYSAYGYDSNYIADGLSYVMCDYESSNITNVIPFGDNIAVCKSDYLYIIRNANNPGNGFVAEYVGQQYGLPVAANVIAVDNTLYWANTHGIFSYDGQQIVEVSQAVRNSLAPFVSSSITSLRADFEKRRIIGYNAATKFIIEPGQEPSLYNYNTAGFRFTSRTLVSEEVEPLLINKIGLSYQYNASALAKVSIDVKINDTWKTESEKMIRPAEDNGRVEIQLANMQTCRKFAMRITSMSASFYVSKIMAHVKTGGVMGYSNK